MTNLKFLSTCLLATALTASVSCNNEDADYPVIDTTKLVYPRTLDDYLEQKASQLVAQTKTNTINENDEYKVVCNNKALPNFGSSLFVDNCFNTQSCVTLFQGQPYLLVVLSNNSNYQGENLFQNGGMAYLQIGTSYNSPLSHYRYYSPDDNYIWLAHKIDCCTSNIILPIFENKKGVSYYTNYIIVQPKDDRLKPDNNTPDNLVEVNLPSIHNASIQFKYQGQEITLRGSNNADLNIKYKQKGNTITFSAEKSTGAYIQKGTALLLQNGFSQIVQTQEYKAGQHSIDFEIDSKSITDKTEYRIVLVTDFVADNGYKYKAGYYSAPLVLKPSSIETARSYTVSPSIGGYVGEAEDNSTIEVKANWNNGKNPYYVTSSENCDVQVKVVGVDKNTVSIKCIKEGGYILNGKIYVFQGISPQKLWHGNILGEKAYKGGYLQTDVDVEFDVSHITRSTKFCVVILPDDPDGNGNHYGYYTGTITVSPEKN